MKRVKKAMAVALAGVMRCCRDSKCSNPRTYACVPPYKRLCVLQFFQLRHTYLCKE